MSMYGYGGDSLGQLQYQAAAASAQIPKSASNSESGTYYTPEQQAYANQMMAQQSKLFDLISGRLGQSGGTDGAGGGGGPGGFGDYFNAVTGAMPKGSFTDVPTGDVITPQMLKEQTNNLFAGGQSDAGMGAMSLFSARPGMAVSPDRAGANAALATAGTRAGIANAYLNKIPQLMFQNQDQRLQSQVAQTNVENSRLNQALQQGQLALGGRQQDIQNNLGLGRLAVDREGNLLHAFNGGGGGGGFLTPLSYSKSSSSSGPSAGFRS